jgi:hypothetical protein
MYVFKNSIYDLDLAGRWIVFTWIITLINISLPIFTFNGTVTRQETSSGKIKLPTFLHTIWKAQKTRYIICHSEVDSHRPISLLPIKSKLFEKLILKRLKPIIADKLLVPTHQFGFRKSHSTIDQVHHVTDIIEKTLEKACALLSYLTLHKLSTQYGIEAYFLNWGDLFPIISI